MAQAAQAPGTRGPRPARTPSTPDVFDERTHRIAHWMLPLVAGLVYGYWVAALDRDAGPITGGNVLLGIVSALAFMILHLAVGAVAPRLRTESRALLWAAFAGIAFGFLYSQNGGTVVRATGLSLLVAVGVLATVFYWRRTHEDAEGRRTGRVA